VGASQVISNEVLVYVGCSCAHSECIWKSGGIAPLILQLVTGWGGELSASHLAGWPPEQETPVPIEQGAGWPQSLCGHFGGKINHLTLSVVEA